MIAFVSVVSLAIWIYLIGFRGGFWRSGPVLAPGSPSGIAKVVAIVPARDEAENIGESLASLLAQDYPGDFAIILVDDNSSDGTADIARSLTGADRLTILAGRPLQNGWSGKLWAMQQGLDCAAARAADYFLLTDADIFHAKNHVSALVAKAEADNLELVSEMVHLNCTAVAERALIPAFVFFFQMPYPFAWVNNPKRSCAGAAGGTILATRAALDRIGGVARIRNCLIDDCALAREIKSAGSRIWLGHAESAWSRRVYAHWRDVWSMVARTAYEQLGNSLFILFGCILGMSLVYLAPPIMALFAGGWPRISGITAWMMMAVAFQPTLRRYGRSPLWGLALPGIGLFYMGATIDSALRHAMGRGGAWKNRVYPGNTAL
jgi:hopene-associated glycosyltransferase HpnB